MKKLYKFYLDCGRMGDLTGIFVAEERDIEKVIDKEIYFGEVLGKHSEIVDTMRKEYFQVLTDDQDFIDKFVSMKCESGYNPLNYLPEEDDGNDDEENKDDDVL